MVGDKDHYHLGGFGGLGDRQHFESRGFRFRPGLAFFIQAPHPVHARIPEVQSMGMALAAVADDGHRAAFQLIQISVFFIKASGHLKTPWKPLPYGRGSVSRIKFVPSRPALERAVAGAASSRLAESLPCRNGRLQSRRNSASLPKILRFSPDRRWLR